MIPSLIPECDISRVSTRCTYARSRNCRFNEYDRAIGWKVNGQLRGPGAGRFVNIFCVSSLCTESRKTSEFPAKRRA